MDRRVQDVLRLMRRALKRVPIWVKLGAVLAAPILAINLCVATLGHSTVFPLSPFFLSEKCSALGQYFQHLPGCIWSGHEDAEPIIARAEHRHGLPRGLLRAVIVVESEQRPHRISSAGAMGLAQLMPGTAEGLNVSDPFDSEDAIDGSARYLAQLLRARKDPRLAIAAYNAGPGNVGRTVPRNGETEFYVAKVMREYRRPTQLRSARSQAP